MTVLFRPYGDLTRAPIARTEADTFLYAFLAEKTGLEITPHEGVDYEDWMEPVCMLEQAIHSGLEIAILPKRPLAEAIANPIALLPGQACRNILMGRTGTMDLHDLDAHDIAWPVARTQSIANHYAELDTFQRHAGRKMRLAAMPGDPESAGPRRTVFCDMVQSLELGAAMADFAPGAVLIKQVYPAKILPLLAFDLPEGFAPESGAGLFIDQVGFHFARFEGDPASLLVQECIDMTHETRFFVINHTVVSGAACIEAHTPMDTPAFDTVLAPTWELERNSGQMDERPLNARKKTAIDMLAFARARAADIAREAPSLDCYTLDVALDAQGQPLIIEINPPAQAGLYATNAIALFQAIHAYAQAAPTRPVATSPANADTDADHL